MIKVEITFRKDSDGKWKTYTSVSGGELPNDVMTELSIGVIRAKDRLNK